MSHAYAVAQVTTQNQAMILTLQGFHSTEAASAICIILWNSTLMARYMDEVGLCLSRKLQHSVQVFTDDCPNLLIGLVHHLGVTDTTQIEREQCPSLWCTSRKAS